MVSPLPGKYELGKARPPALQGYTSTSIRRPFSLANPPTLTPIWTGPRPLHGKRAQRPSAFRETMLARLHTEASPILTARQPGSQPLRNRRPSLAYQSARGKPMLGQGCAFKTHLAAGRAQRADSEWRALALALGMGGTFGFLSRSGRPQKLPLKLCLVRRHLVVNCRNGPEKGQRSYAAKDACPELTELPTEAPVAKRTFGSRDLSFAPTCCYTIYFLHGPDQGKARTQSPTTRNYAVDFPAFGEIAGVSTAGVQWLSLALGEPPS
ncbi:unnamed protein product [Protopolystoma xenopodis]|uniref:Uncharacterized protein n=1 Tax=Protopolystoma xenopodis TaxID=117903 RepID=A0A3S5A778_9PLAT|nr:unnamed protein product [Protopolystoma xenopodis]